MTETQKTIEKKVMLLTGGTDGIGKEYLIAAAKNNFKIYVVCRNIKKSEKVIAEVKSISGNDDIKMIVADLGSLSQTKRAVQEFLNTGDPLHVLMNNAGMFGLQHRTLSEDGLELIFSTNYLSTYALTLGLLGKIRETQGARIINVVSGSYMLIPQFGFDVSRDDYNAEKHYEMLRQYGLSKLSVIYLTKTLAKLLADTDITVNCIDPGAVKTNINRNLYFPLNLAIWRLRITRASEWMSAEKCAQAYWYLTTAQCLGKISGYFFDNKGKLIDPLPIVYNEEYAESMWDLAAQLTGVRL